MRHSVDPCADSAAKLLSTRSPVTGGLDGCAVRALDKTVKFMKTIDWAATPWAGIYEFFDVSGRADHLYPLLQWVQIL